MTTYHDRQTAPPSKCSFKPSLEFNMMNTTFATANSLKKLICVQHRGRCAELARRGTLWCFPNELFVQSSWQVLLDAVLSRAHSLSWLYRNYSCTPHFRPLLGKGFKGLYQHLIQNKHKRPLTYYQSKYVTFQQAFCHLWKWFKTLITRLWKWLDKHAAIYGNGEMQFIVKCSQTIKPCVTRLTLSTNTVIVVETPDTRQYTYLTYYYAKSQGTRRLNQRFSI